MRKGKMVAMGAHASMKVLFDLWDETFESIFELKLDGGSDIEHAKPIKEWITGSFTKITLSVDSEEELMELYSKAQDEGLPCSLVEDNGLTEFNGVKTRTAIAIGPAYPSQVQHLTGELRML